jgi:hypothetical protein
MMNEFDETGGLDIRDDGRLASVLEARGIMTGKVTGMGLYDGLRVEITLDPALQPFLYDHQIGGIPVLPGVMGVEGMAEIAGLLFPDLQVVAVEDVNFYSPFKFYKNQPRTVTIEADFSMDGEDVIACCRLIGSRILHGQTKPELTTHFTSRVRLASVAPEAGSRHHVLPAPENRKLEAADVYRIYFHGPAYQVVQSAWRADGKAVGLYSNPSVPNHQPESLTTVVSPRLIELCFQTAGLWELAASSRMGLPFQIGNVKVYRIPDGRTAVLSAVVTPNDDGSFDAELGDEDGKIYLSLRGYRTMALPEAVAPELLKPFQSTLS